MPRALERLRITHERTASRAAGLNPHSPRFWAAQGILAPYESEAALLPYAIGAETAMLTAAHLQRFIWGISVFGGTDVVL